MIDSGAAALALNNGDFTPFVVLFEDRPKQLMIYQMNLSVYLDAEVMVITEMKQLHSLIRKKTKIDLIIGRTELKGEDLPKKLAKVLAESELKIPIIAVGGTGEIPGVVYIEPTDQVKPILQNAAKILGITAQQMAAKKKEEHFEISSNFLNMLFTLPCDVFRPQGSEFAKLFGENEAISRPKIRILMEKKQRVFIKSLRRLKFANAFTEQVLKAAEELASESVTAEKKMALLAVSVDIVAAQFQNSGMDAEIVNLAQASIKAIEKMADSATNVGSLVKQLMESEGGYRYAHCQLITFLGFHIIKMMDWWGEDQRDIFSQAAFYHDISLSTDQEVKVHSIEQLKALGLTDPAGLDLILTHPQRAARELQNAPDMNNEVVRVVIQHHGTKIGKGFSTDLTGLENLSKAFIVAEEWADYLISLSEGTIEGNNESKILALKEKYKDPLAQQIIETLRYLDPEKFTSDFLVEEEAIVAREPAKEAEAKKAVSLGTPRKRKVYPPGEEPKKKKIVNAEGKEEEVFVVVNAAGEETVITADEAEFEPETVVRGTAATAEEKVRVAGVTEVSEEEVQSIAGDAMAGEEEIVINPRTGEKAKCPARASANRAGPAARPAPKAKREVLGAEGEAIDLEELDSIPMPAGASAAPESEEEVLSAEAVLAGVSSVLSNLGNLPAEEEQTIEGEGETAGEAIKLAGGSDAEKSERRIGADAAAAETETLVKGATAKAAKAKIDGVTEVRKDEIIKIAAEAAVADKKTKINGVTEVIEDKVTVIKADPKNPQGYINRSIAADPKPAGGDLKMKALSGVTDFMSLAFAGDLAKIEAILKEPSAAMELKKTDAEGRTCIHHAAMGGSIPVIKLLLEKGAQKSTVDSKRRSPLYLSALYKKNEAFDFLMAQGCQVKQQAMGGMTIGMVAAFNGNMHILKASIKAGVRLDTTDHTGKKALDYAKLSKAPEAPEIIQFIESGGKV